MLQLEWTRWASVWWLGLAIWTVLLLMPIPAQTGDTLDGITLGRKYLVAKMLHVTAYGVFAWWAGRLHARRRWLILFVLMAHATATELLQHYVVGRNGDLRDVGFDHLGVLIGLLVGWKDWDHPTSRG